MQYALSQLGKIFYQFLSRTFPKFVAVVIQFVAQLLNLTVFQQHGSDPILGKSDQCKKIFHEKMFQLNPVPALEETLTCMFNHHS